MNIFYVSSSTIPIDIGIAQGRSPGPLMFVISMNGIVMCSIDIKCLFHEGNIPLYAATVDIGHCIFTMKICLL